MHEISDKLGAVRRVHHFGVELHAVEFARIVGNGRERRAVRHCHGAEALRQGGHAVAMAHPHRRSLARPPHATKQRRVGGDLERGAAEFAGVAAFHLAAKGSNESLLAVADAEDGHAGLDERGRELRRTGLMHGCRSSGEDDRLGQHRRKRGFRLVEGHDFRIDAGLPHPPRDELGVLRPEIDDEDFIRVVRHGVG